MTEHENSFPPEAVDEQIEQLPTVLSKEDFRLVHDLQRTYQTYAQTNAQSLERVWGRLVQEKGHAQGDHLTSAPFEIDNEQLGNLPPSSHTYMPSSMPTHPSTRLGRLGALAQNLAAIIVVGMLLGGFLVLFVSHHPGLGNPSLHQAAPCGAWRIIKSPNPTPFQNSLDGVAAVSSNDVWAVGGIFNGIRNTQQPLIEHWNGTAWSRVPSPSPDPNSTQSALTGVAIVSANNVWAVGFYYNNNGGQPLIEHWNGTAWSIIPSAKPGSPQNGLTGVTVVTANDIWAVGYAGNSSTWKTLIEHWDGTAWSVVANPNPGSGNNWLSGVAAVSANDVWAVGYAVGSKSKVEQPLIERWNGTVWSVVASPNLDSTQGSLAGVTVITANDIWAVGNATDRKNNIEQALSVHWNGANWRIIASPNLKSLSNEFTGMIAITANDIWAVGDSFSFASNGSQGKPAGQALIEHWDGTSWSVVMNPNPGSGIGWLGAVARVLGSKMLWAVGHSLSSTDNNSAQTLTEFYCP